MTGYLLRDSSWRLMFGIGMLPALILFVGMAFLPNSPRWLALNGQIEEARAVLRRVRLSDEAADRELEEIIENHDVQAPWSELAKPWVRPALTASVGLRSCVNSRASTPSCITRRRSLPMRVSGRIPPC